MSSSTPKYTLKDVACYVDEARGVYAVNAVILLCQAHGFIPESCSDEDCPRCFQLVGDRTNTGWHECLYVAEIEDEATEYMNENHEVKGAAWGRNENGDWGLWTTDGQLVAVEQKTMCEKCGCRCDDANIKAETTATPMSAFHSTLLTWSKPGD